MFKKQKALLAGIFAIILILSSFSACMKKEAPGRDNNTSQPKEIETLALPTEFKPFECSADDYINYDCRINNSTFKFENNTLYLNKGENESKEIFKIDADLIAVAYVKDALYLSTYYQRDDKSDAQSIQNLNEQRLYRIEIDENGNYNKASFALTASALAIPAYIFDNNKLILNVGYFHDDGFEELDTTTGELKNNDFELRKKYSLDLIVENKNEIPSEAISISDANKIALEELKNTKYYDGEEVPSFKAVDYYFCCYPAISAKRFQLSSSGYMSELKVFYKDWNYGKSAENCWAIKADEDIKESGAPMREATIYIDAETGKVLFVRMISDVNKIGFDSPYFY